MSCYEFITEEFLDALSAIYKTRIFLKTIEPSKDGIHGGITTTLADDINDVVSSRGDHEWSSTIIKSLVTSFDRIHYFLKTLYKLEPYHSSLDIDLFVTLCVDIDKLIKIIERDYRDVKSEDLESLENISRRFRSLITVLITDDIKDIALPFIIETIKDYFTEFKVTMPSYLYEHFRVEINQLVKSKHSKFVWPF